MDNEVYFVNLIFFIGFQVSSFIGGRDVSLDRKKLQKSKSIVGTPGRITHLIKNNVLNTSKMRVVVLDEVDKLLTDTFSTDIDFIFKSLPKKRQVIGSSATYDKNVEAALTDYMKNPIGVTPRKEAPVLLGVKQFAYDLHGADNLKQMQEMNLKVKAVVSILSIVPFKQCLIFSNSQQRAESYSNYITNEGWPCDVINGSQEQSTRLDIFKKFKEFKCRILVATDLMARGIDSENVNLVINLDVPNDSAMYLHRIGRCGRFGSHGIAITLVHCSNEMIKFRKLLGSIGGSDMKVMDFELFQMKTADRNLFSDANTVDEQCGVISGVTEMQSEEPNERRENDQENGNQVTDTARKNLDLMEICKRLVDQPENGNVAPEEDLLESYSMIVNGSCNASELDDQPAAVLTNKPEDVNRQFIDAISRLNLYPDESTTQNDNRQSNSSKDVNESSDNSKSSDLNSDTDGSNVGSDKASEFDSCDSESDCSCSYAQSESDNEVTDDDYDQCDAGSKNDLESRWHSQFIYQISLIQNYVSNTRYMMGKCRRMKE